MRHGQTQRWERRGRVAIVIVAWVGSSLPATAGDPVSRPDSRRAIHQLSRLGEPDSPNALCGGEPCDAVLRGLFHFFDRSPDGLAANGRSCGDCHMVTDRFQLSPASAELRFQLLQWRLQFDPHADDPLFRPIDADDFRTNGEDASDYSNLRQNGLVRITFDLPPNVALIDPATNEPSAETFADVWRAVPTVNDVKLSGSDGQNPWPRDPNRTGGYQLDGRVATLQEQALGALINHAQVQGAPAQAFLDDLHSFQRVLFTNSRVRALSEAIDAGVTPLPDPDPPLNALEQQGKVVFVRACAHCHGGAGQSTTMAPISRYHNIFTQCPRPVDTANPPRFAFTPCPPELARNTRTYEITLANTTKIRQTTSDPARGLLTGFAEAPNLGDWNRFDVPGLRGINKTAPYFHNNSAPSLEEVVHHYIQLFKRIQANAPPGSTPGPVVSTDGIHFDRIPLPEEVPALLAYLKKL